MIVFDLICHRKHRFEGWFSSPKDFEEQKRCGMLACPLCGDSTVRKVPSSKIKRAPQSEEPRRKVTAATTPAPAHPRPTPPASNVEQGRVALMALVEHVVRNSEDVGERFAEEARRMHYKEVPERAIRGTASREEAEELLEEGIAVVPLPVPPSTDLH